LLFYYVLFSTVLLTYSQDIFLKNIYKKTPYTLNNAELHAYLLERMDLVFKRNIFYIIFFTFREDILGLLLLLGLLFFIKSKIFITIILIYVLFNFLKIIFTVTSKYFKVLELVYENDISIKEAYKLSMKTFSYEYVETVPSDIKLIYTKKFLKLKEFKTIYQANDGTYYGRIKHSFYKISEEDSLEENLSNRYMYYSSYILENISGPILFTIVGLILWNYKKIFIRIIQLRNILIY